MEEGVDCGLGLTEFAHGGDGAVMEGEAGEVFTPEMV